jgi:hypothetical protein
MIGRRTCRLVVMLAAVIPSGSGPAPLVAKGDPSGLCVDAASRAAENSGVPFDVLLAVSVVETGRNDRPWPWTVNAGGEGRWFDTADEAKAHAQSILEQGLTNVDLGCFQLNVRWHAQAFGSISDMLDPDLNAGYAAEFLAGHYSRTGDWAAAAAAYHSATPEYAERYRSRFEVVYAALDPASAASTAETDARQNRFPLLVSGNAGRNGSLVPAIPGGGSLIGGN